RGHGRDPQPERDRVVGAVPDVDAEAGGDGRGPELLPGQPGGPGVRHDGVDRGVGRQLAPASAVGPPGEEVEVALPEPVERLGQPARVDAGTARPGGNSRDVEEEAHRRRVYEGPSARPPLRPGGGPLVVPGGGPPLRPGGGGVGRRAAGRAGRRGGGGAGRRSRAAQGGVVGSQVGGDAGRPGEARRPAAPSEAARPSSESSRSRAPARASASPAGTSRAASPTTSGRAPASEATTGQPLAIASSAGSPNPSERDGTASAAAPR